MIHLYGDLKSEIDEEQIKLSEELVEQLRVLESVDYAQKLAEIDERIWGANEAYQRDVACGNSSMAKVSGTALQRAQQEKRWLKDQQYRQRGELIGMIEQLTLPVIEGAGGLIDNATSKIRAEISVTWKDERKVYGEEPTRSSDRPIDPIIIKMGGPWENDYHLIKIETNREAIREAVTLLIGLKGNLNKMHRSSISSILSTVKEAVDKVNEIDLKKVGIEEIGELAYKELTQPEKPPTVSPEVFRLAKVGEMTEVIDKARALVQEIKDEAAARVTDGKITKYDKLPGGAKAALDVVYGKGLK